MENKEDTTSIPCLNCDHPKVAHKLAYGDGKDKCLIPSCSCDRARFATKVQATKNDPVNHPSHYTAYSGLEIIELTEQMNFNRGNAVKYISRAGFKGDDKTEVEDLKKARWYLDREIDRITKGEDDGRVDRM